MPREDDDRNLVQGFIVLDFREQLEPGYVGPA